MIQALFLLLLFFLKFLSLRSYSLKESNYCSVLRTRLQHSEIISLYPKGWMTKAIKPFQKKDHNYITDIIWTPSRFTLAESDFPENLVDDDHFCSRLADIGFVVHIVSKTSDKQILHAISEAVKWRSSKVLPRNIALLANELSTIHNINYLSTIALPMTSSRVDIGAVILLDPLPINSLLTEQGRNQIISRYTEPLLRRTTLTTKKKSKLR